MMSETAPDQLTVLLPDVPAEHRKKLRIGFMLCCAALALALFALLGTFGAGMFALISGVNLEKEFELKVKLVRSVSDAVFDALFVGGVVSLYLAPTGPRWRWVSSALLLMVGMDVAFLCLRIADAGPAVLALTELIGNGLGWAELWLLAILAADAAEALLRSDITYQTEVAGRLIVVGAVAWLAFVIWTFDPTTFVEPAANPRPDEFAVILGYSMIVMQLFALGRSVLFCGGLASALGHPVEPPPSGQAATSND